MKRYNITAETIPGNDTWAEDSRIKIDEATNGEWVRYEDVTDTKMFCEMSNALQDMKTFYRDQILQLAAIKEAFDAYNAAPGYANWQEKHKLHSLLGMIK